MCSQRLTVTRSCKNKMLWCSVHKHLWWKSHSQRLKLNSVGKQHNRCFTSKWNIQLSCWPQHWLRRWGESFQAGSSILQELNDTWCREQVPWKNAKLLNCSSRARGQGWADPPHGGGHCSPQSARDRAVSRTASHGSQLARDPAGPSHCSHGPVPQGRRQHASCGHKVSPPAPCSSASIQDHSWECEILPGQLQTECWHGRLILYQTCCQILLRFPVPLRCCLHLVPHNHQILPCYERYYFYCLYIIALFFHSHN